MSQKRNLYILCGSKSRRIGRDKALLNIDGKSLLNKQILKSSAHFKEIVLMN